MDKLTKDEVKKQTIIDTKNWIDENITNNISVKIVAERSGYTNWHFQRLFKEFHGIPLGHYIRIKRLILSAKDLQSTDEKILDISIRYGFSSQQTFSRSFKTVFKKTPKEYRKSYKQKNNEK